MPSQLTTSRLILIDSRIFSLLETLAASNLDWLVKDIFAAIEMGDTQIASEHAIFEVQERIRLQQDLRADDDEQTEKVPSRPWSGDEQVVLAADIVLDRLKQSLIMSQYSIEAVSRIIGEEKEEPFDLSIEGVVLLDGDGNVAASMGGADVEYALGNLDQLRLAVEVWKSEMLNGTEAQ